MKHNSISEIIDSIVAARKAKNLSQSEMARRMGLPQSYISRLENRKLDVRISSLLEIARFLELEILLVPKSMVPSVEGLIRLDKANDLDKPLYTLDDIEVDGD